MQTETTSQGTHIDVVVFILFKSVITEYMNYCGIM